MSTSKMWLWLSHDAMFDRDDNLASLVGTAKALDEANRSDAVEVRAFVSGDTLDSVQYRVQNSDVDDPIPAAFGTDSRTEEQFLVDRAVANSAFHRDYVFDAVRELSSDVEIYDLIAADQDGLRAWDFTASRLAEISAPAAELVLDIIDAISEDALVVYSAGGGANVPAEAIAILRSSGYSEALLLEHVAIVQHGGSNWVGHTEAVARDITRPYTIAISDQNRSTYANGDEGPGLNNIERGAPIPSATEYGPEFREALAVATGEAKPENLPESDRFEATRDASDAGSHAFAADMDAVLAALPLRLQPGEELEAGNDNGHAIFRSDGSVSRERVMYDDFDWQDARDLLDGPPPAPSAAPVPLAASTQAAPASVAAEAPAAETGPVRIEAEAFNFAGGYSSTRASTASGGEVAWIRKSNEAGTMGLDLAPAGITPGTYDLRIRYIDEADGASAVAVSVASGGVETRIDAWDFDDDGRSGNGTQEQNYRTRLIEDVAVTADAQLFLRAESHFGEHARIDYVEFF